ncbi:PadR family transcriptional regulator, partial [Nocardia gipuzkoensis]
MEELGAGVAFMDALPRARVIELLSEQRRRATEIRDDLQAMMPEFPGRYEAPHSPDLLELWSGVFAGFSDWTGRLVRRLEAGE